MFHYTKYEAKCHAVELPPITLIDIIDDLPLFAQLTGLFSVYFVGMYFLNLAYASL